MKKDEGGVTCNPSTQEMKARGLVIQGYLQFLRGVKVQS